MRGGDFAEWQAFSAVGSAGSFSTAAAYCATKFAVQAISDGPR